MQAILDAGGLLVPLTDEGEVRALVALAIAAQIGGTVEPVDAAGVVIEADAAGDGAAEIAGQAVPAGFAPLTPGPRGAPVVRGGLDLLHDVEMEVTAELGPDPDERAGAALAGPGRGDRAGPAAGGPADLLVNGRLIARGEVVVIDENFGIRITEIVSS